MELFYKTEIEVAQAYKAGRIGPEVAAAYLKKLRPGRADIAPIPSGGPDVPWREWVPRYYLRRACAPFANYHENLWEWFDGLVLDQKSDSAVVPWARGLGKSTSLEGGIVRTCVRGTRRFWLYVSRTLEDANNHVTSIARTLEWMGIERQINRYGLATGWNAQRLRTASGFSLLSFGLDAGARGVKLEDVRPDGIALDDIDHLGDSEEMVEKKCTIISNTIMQAGSPSFAAIFVQNPIGPHTVMSRVMDGRLAIMADRNLELAKVIPAVYDLRYEIYHTEDGRERARITGGTSSWEGKTLDDWQYQIDKGTLDGFLIECQHEIHINAVFFDRYSDADHHTAAEHVPIGIEGARLPTWYHVFAGFDWGYSDAAALVLCAADERGAVHGLTSWEVNRLSNDDLAAKIVQTLKEWGIPLADCPIYADGSMWAQKTFNGVKAKADVEYFFAAGLRMVQGAQGAAANRFRNSAIRVFLRMERMFRLYRGYNHRLAECLKSAQPAKTDREQVMHNAYSHLIAALGHAMETRPRIGLAIEPPKVITPEDEASERQRVYDATQKRIWEQPHVQAQKRRGMIPLLDAEKNEMRDDAGDLIFVPDRKR